MAGLTSLFLALAGIFGPWIILLFLKPRSNFEPKHDSNIVQPKEHTPSVSFIIPIHEHCDTIKEKVLEAAGQLMTGRDEILIFLDGLVQGSENISPDVLSEIISDNGLGEIPCKTFTLPRLGKNASLNKAGEVARGDILVISDRDARLGDNALPELLLSFSDAQVGTACGHLCIEGDKAKEQQRYWGLEAQLKAKEMLCLGNITAANGSLLAIRKAVYPIFPAGCADDMFAILHAVKAGYRSVFVEKAIVFSSPRGKTTEQVMRRQRRVVSGGLLSLYHHKSLLNPFSYGFYAAVLFCHKLLRRLVPLLLILSTCLLLSLITPLASLLIFSLLLGAYYAIYALSCEKFSLKIIQPKILKKALYLYAVGLGITAGIFDFLLSKKNNIW